MKIIHLIGRYNQGGTASWLNVLIPELVDAGHEVQLFAGDLAEGENEDAHFIKFGGTHLGISPRSLKPLGDLQSIVEFRKILKTQSPGILNTHTTKAGLIGRIAAIGLPIRVVHTYHGHLIQGYFSSVGSMLYVKIERFLAKFTDVFITVGERVAHELIEARICEATKFQVIYPAIQPPILKNRAKARETYNLGNEFVGGWLGRVTQIKRPDILNEVARLNPDVQFLVGGDGDLFESMKKVAPSNVRYIGWVEPFEFWTACDFAILTSDNEGLPTSLIEAAMSGIPIVANDVGSVCETFEDGVGGVLVRGDVTYQNAIEGLKNELETTLVMGKNAKHFAENRFTKIRFIEKHLQSYFPELFTKL
jgi:glycosyltransferase involved in cell wall biosynthesis